MNPEQRSIRSAQAQPKVIVRWLKMLNGGLVNPLRIVQRWFYRFDLGDGYVATAVKRQPVHAAAARSPSPVHSNPEREYPELPDRPTG